VLHGDGPSAILIVLHGDKHRNVADVMLDSMLPNSETQQRASSKVHADRCQHKINTVKPSIQLAGDLDEEQSHFPAIPRHQTVGDLNHSITC